MNSKMYYPSQCSSDNYLKQLGILTPSLPGNVKLCACVILCLFYLIFFTFLQHTITGKTTDRVPNSLYPDETPIYPYVSTSYFGWTALG